MCTAAHVCLTWPTAKSRARFSSYHPGCAQGLLVGNLVNFPQRGSWKCRQGAQEAAGQEHKGVPSKGCSRFSSDERAGEVLRERSSGRECTTIQTGELQG
ncbi:hypothetical protein AMTR_s00009p00259920 [Amborella trichopoda]|uniref:Uncharacterized protein n=1 Tax=Amborella trichopoda TaxID=13333 RepID=W1NIX8_AMBTC|nr:hypothetical protein AMTR_s00009p00259920 [Amborella trichopoda]